MLSLTLFVFFGFTRDPDHAFSLVDFTITAHLFYRSSHFHRITCIAKSSRLLSFIYFWNER